MHHPPYFTTEKRVGETPLEALERARSEHTIAPGVPLAYAGRLDPMASGTLLILVGDTCKVQEQYHSLDKEYVFEVLIGIGSDTHDVLGIAELGNEVHPDRRAIEDVLSHLRGTITLPYPHFSSKTVAGKPLHMWTLEGKLHEIEIPTRTSTIYSLTLQNIRTIDGATLDQEVRTKVNSIPPVTDERKALGRDFRRTEVHASWDSVLNHRTDSRFTILTLTCVASSGTYMRTLASVIGERLGTKALAYSIHRTRIGVFVPIPCIGGFFRKTY